MRALMADLTDAVTDLASVRVLGSDLLDASLRRARHLG
jgi:hypothetical protein